jgi:hypothetical protein
MPEGLWTLLGTAVGAGATLVGTVLHDRRQDQRDRENRDREGQQAAERAEAEQRHAEQIMAAEIANALEKVGEVLPSDDSVPIDRWPIGFATWSATWVTARDQLATRLDQDTYIAFDTAYERLRELERGMGGKGGQPLSAEDKKFFMRAKHQLEHTRELLSKRSRR